MMQAPHSPSPHSAVHDQDAADRSGAYWPPGMKKSTLDQAVWTLIYGGLIVAMLGLWSRPQMPTFGGLLAAGGGLGVLAGAVLVWVRSRGGEDDVSAADAKSSPSQGKTPR